ncbi:MAG: hypothetical protein KDC11_04690 [Chitinophagaceae bacterium]|nr:hypothetical protein [Chitinophagaceae bacterium]
MGEATNDNSIFGHNLHSFVIEGLFEKNRVELVFDDQINILIGENGLGKTTILNILYYTLTRKFKNLYHLPFNRLIITFRTGLSAEILKEDIEELIDDNQLYYRSIDKHRIDRAIQNVLDDDEILFLQDNYDLRDEVTQARVNEIRKKLAYGMNFPQGQIRRYLTLKYSGKRGRINKANDLIKNELNSEILYFPTYRRIEEELHKLGALDQIELPHDDNRLIQFGMQDVNASFNLILERIKNSSIEEFSAVTGEMLSQYLEGAPSIDQDLLEKINVEILNIILERVGENITSENKLRIIELVSSKEIFDNQDYQYLLNFLTKLVKIYDNQRSLDNKIKGFGNM